MTRGARAEPSPSQDHRRRLVQVLIIVAVAVIAALYLYPRVYDLVAMPYRLDAAVTSADSYNPALDEIVAHEQVTLAAFDALDDMDAALTKVKAIDADVDRELAVLIGQIREDIQVTLRKANTNVTALVGQLDALTAHVQNLTPAVQDTDAALIRDRVRLDEILTDARNTADQVHRTRLSADSSAADLSGQK